MWHKFSIQEAQRMWVQRDYVILMFPSSGEEDDPTKKGNLHISCLPSILPDDTKLPKNSFNA